MNQSLFESIPDSEKSEVYTCSDNITLANNQSVDISATAMVHIKNSVNDIGHFVFVYVLKNASHPHTRNNIYERT